MHRPFGFPVRLLIAAFAAGIALPAPVARGQVEGGPNDGGAWRAGDFWRFNRQFHLRMNDVFPGSPGTITFNERFTKTVDVVTPVIEASNSIDGPQRVYVRNRSAATLSGSGLWFIPTGAMSNLASASILFTVLPGGTSSGFDWRRVSDLAEVRENFAINGTVRARITAFTTLGAYGDNFNIAFGIDFTLDNGPALEYADFPLEQIGEVWTTVPMRNLSGEVILKTSGYDFIGILTLPATTVSYPLDTTARQTFIQNYAATAQSAPLLGGGTFGGTERINVAGFYEGDTLYWSGTAKEFVDHTTGNSPVLTTLFGFRTSLSGSASGTDYGVTPDSVIFNVAFNPARPGYNGAFQMTFSGGPATVILRDHAGNQQTVPAATSPVVLTAPPVNDDSPTSGVNQDFGSYGVEFIVGGHNVQLATVRLSQITDCNSNGINDATDIAMMTSTDCNLNGVPDECEPDCNSNGIPDGCDITAITSTDCNLNGVPDECEPDCNSNGIPDDCDIAAMASTDCNLNGVPDECEADCNSNDVPDECDIASMSSPDCNSNGIPDECDIASMSSPDCNSNGVPDECDIAAMTSADCNSNGVPDECDITATTSNDCNLNDVPDECEPDCNSNGIPDDCDIASMTSDDCNLNGVPDECEPDCNSNGIADECDIAAMTSNDCNANGIPDECETDCNSNGVPDECDIASMTSQDCNANGIPDECEPDCNTNGVPDDCDLASMTSTDCNANSEPDECDIAAMTSEDCNSNDIPDECELPVTLAVVYRGWWRSDGFHNQSNEIAVAGRTGGSDYNAYLIFDISGASGSVSGLTLRMEVADYGSVDPSETLAVYQVTTDPAEVEASGSGRTDIYADLESGPLYGTKNAVPADEATVLEIPLGPAAVDDYNAAVAGAEPLFALGLHITTVSGTSNQAVWLATAAEFRVDELVGTLSPGSGDCNSNGIPDECEIAAMSSTDCNLNGVPDECEPDCNSNGIADECDITAMTSLDCNLNGVPDECDLSSMTSQDCNSNGIPDECDFAAMTSQDCNLNGVPDECDIAAMTSEDCNGNGMPDECETMTCHAMSGVTAGAALTNAYAYDIDVWPFGISSHLNLSSEADDAGYATLAEPEGVLWTTLDPGPSDEVMSVFEFHVAPQLGIAPITSLRIQWIGGVLNGGASVSVNMRDYSRAPYEGAAWREIATAAVTGQPESHTFDVTLSMVQSLGYGGFEDLLSPSGQLAFGVANTTNSDNSQVIDYVRLCVSEGQNDCNINGVPDDCDIAALTSQDCNSNGIPDECEADCNSNGVPDDCDIAALTSQDCNANGFPDECELGGEGTFALQALHRGWWNQDGLHNAANNIVYIGQQAGAMTSQYNAYLIFDVSALPPGIVTTAGLRLEVVGFNGPDASETIGVYDVSADPAMLEADGSGQTAIYTDLQSGAQYCAFGVTPADVGSVLEVPLDAQARTDLFDAIVGASGMFAVGLHNETIAGPETDSVRLTTGDEYRVLELTVEIVPGDCNSNGIPDECDIAAMSSADLNMNGVPDECEPTPTPLPSATASPDPSATPTASATPSPSPAASASPSPVTLSPSPAAASPSPATPSPSPAAPSPSPTPVCCPGDADNSMGQVNAQDFLAVQANFGLNNGTGGLGDADCSGGAVNANDFLAVQANFGASCG